MNNFMSNITKLPNGFYKEDSGLESKYGACLTVNVVVSYKTRLGRSCPKQHTDSRTIARYSGLSFVEQNIILNNKEELLKNKGYYIARLQAFFKQVNLDAYKQSPHTPYSITINCPVTNYNVEMDYNDFEMGYITHNITNDLLNNI